MLDDFLPKLVVSIAQDLFKAGASRLRDEMFGDAEQRALQSVYESAFSEMLKHHAASLNPEYSGVLDDILRKFVRDATVNDLLLDVAFVRRTPKIDKLLSRFTALGFEPDRLPLDFETMIKAFVDTLQARLEEEAGKPQSPLHNRLVVKSFGDLQTTQNELQTLVKQALAGQDDSRILLAKRIERLEGHLHEIRALLDTLLKEYGQKSIVITVDSSGSVVTTGDIQVHLPDRGLLGDWWQRIGPSPDIVIEYYLGMTEKLYQHIQFPLGRISRPLRMDEVYVDLPIVKPRSIESLLAAHAGQRVGGSSVPRVDHLLQLGKPAAIVGGLGTGKTTTLQHLAWIYAQRPQQGVYWRGEELIPFYAQLQDLARLWSVDLVDGLAIAVSGGPRRQVVNAQMVWRALHAALEQGNALILLDALDEFRASPRERSDFVTALQRVWQTPPFANNPILLTSRPYRFLNPNGFDQYVLQDLEDAGPLSYRLGKAILQARGDLDGHQIEPWLELLLRTIDSPHLQRFRNPFYVTLMVGLGTGGDSPEQSLSQLQEIWRLADLYLFFLRQTIKWEELKDNVPQTEPETALLLLGYVAYRTFENPSEKLHVEELATGLKIGTEEVQGTLEFWKRTGLLRFDEPRSAWVFYHSEFRAFGVALVMYDKVRHGQRQEVDELWKRYELAPEWQTVWQLLYGLLGRKTL
jgi:hypothetical protein